MADLLKFVQDEFVTRKDFPEFGAGDTITVYYEIKEGEKTRTQFFKGEVQETLKLLLFVKCQELLE
jgi:large subunit ribosomal protein L19